MSITSQPVRVFPAMASHGNPAGVPSISVHTCARALARARAIRSSMAAIAGQVQGPPHRRPARRVPQHRGQVRQHRDVAHAGGPERDRRRHRDQHDPPVENGRCPRLPQRRTQGSGQSRLVSGLAEQDRARVADQARPAVGDLQGMVPPRILHGEERSSLREVAQVVVTCNLPEPGRSSPLT